jgi:hypothetical protein
MSLLFIHNHIYLEVHQAKRHTRMSKPWFSAQEVDIQQYEYKIIMNE